MAVNRDISVIAVHGAWADGSSWKDVILSLEREGLRVIAAPIPLTSLSDDTAALKRAISRTQGPVILAGHAYAGAVIGAVNDDRVKALVYIAALAPDEGDRLLRFSIVMKNTHSRLNLPQMRMVSSGCRMKASEMLSHSMRRMNKSHYRQLSRGQSRSNVFTSQFRNQRGEPSPPGS
jgi:pimeloyl-ACP methyl ester carboxylesterase